MSGIFMFSQGHPDNNPFTRYASSNASALPYQTTPNEHIKVYNPGVPIDFTTKFCRHSQSQKASSGAEHLECDVSMTTVSLKLAN